MDAGFEHWKDVRDRLATGIFSVTDELALIERDGFGTAETSYLTAKYSCTTVPTPPLLDTMAAALGKAAVQVFMTTPLWARQLARRGVDMIAVGPNVMAQHEPGLAICRGDGKTIGCYPDRTLLLVDVATPAKIAATFARARCNRVVYLGRKITIADHGDAWHLADIYPTFGHQTGSELRVYERTLP